MPPFIDSAAALTTAAGPTASWLWHGYLGLGAFTLMTSQWKTGKTTLAAVLLSKMKAGGQLAGFALAAGKAVVVCEEGPSHWLRRHQKLDFGDHIGWFCQPFRGKPRRSDWFSFIDGLVDLHQHRPFDLLVLDPLAAFLPGSENDAGAVLEALSALQSLMSHGVAIWALHHPRKDDPAVGKAARGSGAISGFADILIEMRFCPGAADDDRGRRLWASSRFPETPRGLVIEWTADGTDYVSNGSFLEAELAQTWPQLHAMLRNAENKLTRADILSEWPGAQPPTKSTLKRWLERGLQEGLIRRDGAGIKDNLFRYWLPERETEWRKDFNAQMRMPELLWQPG